MKSKQTEKNISVQNFFFYKNKKIFAISFGLFFIFLCTSIYYFNSKSKKISESTNTILLDASPKETSPSIEKEKITTVSLAGEEYPIFYHNNKMWLGKNLNFEMVGQSWCYRNDSNLCKRYGRLYNWKAAQKVCQNLGEGWRLSSKEDWEDLRFSFKGFGSINKQGKNIGKALLEKSEDGFNAVCGGWYEINKERFYAHRELDYYWTTGIDERDTSKLFIAFIDCKAGYSSYSSTANNKSAFYCRCVKDVE